MGCTQSKLATHLGVTFEYDRHTTSEREGTSELTTQYFDVDFNEALEFPRVTIEGTYPLVIYFHERAMMLIFRPGSALLVFRQDEKLVSTVTWVFTDRYQWIEHRLRRLGNELAMSVFGARQNFHPLEGLRASLKQAESGLVPDPNSGYGLTVV